MHEHEINEISTTWAKSHPEHETHSKRTSITQTGMMKKLEGALNIKTWFCEWRGCGIQWRICPQCYTCHNLDASSMKARSLSSLVLGITFQAAYHHIHLQRDTQLELEDTLQWRCSPKICSNAPYLASRTASQSSSCPGSFNHHDNATLLHIINQCNVADVECWGIACWGYTWT